MTKQRPETENAIINALKAGEERGFEEVYRRYFRLAASFIQNNNGDSSDAEDIFQEMLFILVKKMRSPDFQLTAKLSTYIFSIIRNLWLQRLRKKGLTSLEPFDAGQEFLLFEEDELEVKKAFEQKHQLVASIFKDLKEDCKKIINASFYKKWSHAEIAERMDYSSNFVRVKLHRCMESLRKKVKEHPDYKNI